MLLTMPSLMQCDRSTILHSGKQGLGHRKKRPIPIAPALRQAREELHKEEERATTISRRRRVDNTLSYYFKERATQPSTKEYRN